MSALLVSRGGITLVTMPAEATTGVVRYADALLSVTPHHKLQHDGSRERSMLLRR